jgi:hypothetical protein
LVTMTSRDRQPSLGIDADRRKPFKHRIIWIGNR